MLNKARHITESLLDIPFVRDVATLQIGSVFVTGLSFVKSIVFARMLGLEGFGLYAVVLAFTGTFGLLTNVGQNQAAITFFAEGYEKNNRRQMRTILKYYLQVVIVTATILSTLLLATPWLIGKFYDNLVLVGPAQLFFVAVMAGLLNELFIVLLQTVREIKKLTVLENCNHLFQLVFATVFLILDFGVYAPFLGIFIGNILMLGILLYLYKWMREKYKLPSLREAVKEKSPTKEYWTQGLWIAMDKNIGGLFPQGFLFLMSLYAAPATVGIARLAFKIAGVPSEIILAHVVRMSGTVLPAIAAKGNSELRKNCAKLIKHGLAIHSLGSFCALLVLPVAVIVMYGHSYGPVVEPMMWIILIRIVSGLNIANAPLFRILRKTHVPAMWNAITMPIQLGAFFGLLNLIDPLEAFVWIILVRLSLNLWLNWYLFTKLRR